MDPITLGLLLGGGGGLLKSIFSGAGEARDRKIQAETTRYSPWTGMQAQAPKRTDWFGNLLSGSLGGASFAQGLGKSLSGIPTESLKDAVEAQGGLESLGDANRMSGSVWGNMMNGRQYT